MSLKCLFVDKLFIDVKPVFIIWVLHNFEHQTSIFLTSKLNMTWKLRRYSRQILVGSNNVPFECYLFVAASAWLYSRTWSCTMAEAHSCARAGSGLWSGGDWTGGVPVVLRALRLEIPLAII